MIDGPGRTEQPDGAGTDRHQLDTVDATMVSATEGNAVGSGVGSAVIDYEMLVVLLRSHRPSSHAGLCLSCGTNWPCVAVLAPLAPQAWRVVEPRVSSARSAARMTTEDIVRVDGNGLVNLNRAIRDALGTTIRHAREARGWTQAVFASRTPSRVGIKTVTAYEKGDRELPVTRLVEFALTVGMTATGMLGHALQDARLLLTETPLRVDLHEMVAAAEADPAFAGLIPWCKHRITRNPGGVTDIHPIGVCELAAALGMDHTGLANWMAAFLPSLSAAGDS